MATSRALDVSLASPSTCLCRYLVDIIVARRSGSARWTMRRARTSHATAEGIAISNRSCPDAVQLTSTTVLAIVSGIVVGVPHELCSSPEQTVRELNPTYESGDRTRLSTIHTASTKSPAAARKAAMTWGVMTRLVGSFMLSGSTSTGSKARVRARSLLTNSRTQSQGRVGPIFQ